MNTRHLFLGAVALGLALSVCDVASAEETKPRKVLFFTKSSGFEHSVIKHADGKPAYAENILTELGPKHGIEFTYSKDGSLFTPEYLAKFDAFMFYTTGDFLAAGKDAQPPMSADGKAAFLDAIKNGKGFVGIHSATDTYHTGETVDTNTTGNRASRYANNGDKADPYIRMIGAEFIVHGKQQNSHMHVIDPNFPGFAQHSADFELTEEWYSLIDFSKDLHVLLLQDTTGMSGTMYQRPAYPATWARMYGQGRVFYTSMGHREDVWTNPMFQDILFGGIAWAVHNVDADVTPNIEQVAPGAWTLPPIPPPTTKPAAK